MNLGKWLAEQIINEVDNQITVLFPGGFKPPHGGHLELAKRYANHPNVNQLIILIGPEAREGITRAQSIAIWRELTKNNKKIIVQKTDVNSPILTAYKFMETAPAGTYALAASTKDDDYKRVRQFVTGHQPGGKYAREGVEVVDLPLNTSPIVYKRRSDAAQRYVTGKSENGKGVSASVLRADLRNGDLEAFATNYPNASKDSVVKIFDMLTQNINESNILTEAAANTHLTHLEELILTQGQDGYKLARKVLMELVKNLKGMSDAKVNTSIKWDGAPAIFSGVDPDTDQFFVGTKSVFNKEPKLNYTAEDIERNHGNAPGLVDKLKRALIELPKLGYSTIMQGDFMFDDSTLKLQTINGVKHYTFRPNTITYAVEANSDLGKQMARAKFGIVFHTSYKDLQSGAQFGANVDTFKRTPDVWFDDAFFKDTTGTVLLTDSEAKQVLKLIKQADSINVDYRQIPSELLNTYINSEIRIGQFLESPDRSFLAFTKWLQARTDKKVAGLKTTASQQKAIDTGASEIQQVMDNKQDIVNAFKVTKLLAEAKMIFVEKYNNAVYRTKHFIDDGQGGLQVSNPEGYVAVDHIGNGVKLVDRLEFSRANFTMDRGFAK
jgi:hypothetical protein